MPRRHITHQRLQAQPDVLLLPTSVAFLLSMLDGGPVPTSPWGTVGAGVFLGEVGVGGVEGGGGGGGGVGFGGWG